MPALFAKNRLVLAMFVIGLGSCPARAAQWSAGVSRGACCVPNAATYGYIPTEWGRWPGSDVQTSSANARQEAFPPPRYELPKPLHEAEGGPAPLGPTMGSPMATPTEPSTGLPDSTRPMGAGSKSTRNGDSPTRPMGTMPEINPFEVNPAKNGDMNRSKNGAMPLPDSSSRRRLPLPELAKQGTVNAVLPASAAIAEPSRPLVASHANSIADTRNAVTDVVDAPKTNSANPLRNEPVTGWRPVEKPAAARSLDEVNDAPRSKPSSNPLRGD